MYENKVVWFLNDRVLGREIRASRYTKARTTADSVPVRQTLEISAIKGYVAAVVDLWSFQKSKSLNSHSNPRGEALNDVLRARAPGDGGSNSRTGPRGYCRTGTARRRWSTPSAFVGMAGNNRPSRTCVPSSTFFSPVTSCCGASSRLLYNPVTGRRPNTVFSHGHHGQRQNEPAWIAGIRGG